MNMPTSRSEMPAVVLGDLIYVVGGFGNAQEEFAARALEAARMILDKIEEHSRVVARTLAESGIR